MWYAAENVSKTQPDRHTDCCKQRPLQGRPEELEGPTRLARVVVAVCWQGQGMAGQGCVALQRLA